MKRFTQGMKKVKPSFSSSAKLARIHRCETGQVRARFTLSRFTHSAASTLFCVFALLRRFVSFRVFVPQFALLTSLLLLSGCASHPLFRSANYPNSSANLPAGNSAPTFNDPYAVGADSANAGAPTRAPSAGSLRSSGAASGTPASGTASGTPASGTAASGAMPLGASSQGTSPSAAGGVPRTASPAAQKDSRSTTIVPVRTDENGSAWSTMDLILGPKNVIARPGSEVILTAGVRDRSGYLRTNQRIEWAISPNSVGHFSKIQDRELANVLVFDFVKPQILSDTRAVTTTSRSELILDRGTPNLNDDIVVRRGESWVSVSSPREGVTMVSAVAPKVANTSGRMQTSRIVWVDAAVKLPESKVLDFGSTYTLTTALRRVSDEQPLERWRVRYEICGNSSAVFGDGNKMLEVYTNSRGEAKIEMRQPIARQEKTVVSIQIIRPAEGDFLEPVVIQDSRVHFQWNPNTINIIKTMPQEAFIGSIVPAVISVTNLTDRPLRNVRVVDLQQPGLVMKGAVPEGQDALDGRQWLIDSLAPFETYSIQINYRVEQPGSYLSFAQVQTQKMGNDLIVECSARLSAGGDTSPFTPPLPKLVPDTNSGTNSDANSNANADGNSGDSDTEKTFEGERQGENSGAAGSSAGSTRDPFGGTTEPLPPPADETEDVYVPGAGSSASGKDAASPSGTASPSSAAPPSTPPIRPDATDRAASDSEIAARSPELAPVYPREDPNAQVGLAILANARVSLNQPFRVSIQITNQTAMDLRNVGIQVANTHGLSNQSQKDLYFVERNIRNLPSRKTTKIRTEFLPVLDGDQVITVTLILPNGKEYRREARLRVLPGTGESVAAPGEAAIPAPSAVAPETPGNSTSSPDLAPPPALDAPSASETPSAPETPPTPDSSSEMPENSAAESAASPANAPASENDPVTELPDSLTLPDSAPLNDPASPKTSAPKNSPAKSETSKKAGSKANSTPKETSAATIRRPANPLPHDSAATVGAIIDEEDEQSDPSFTVTLAESQAEIHVGGTFSYTLKLINTTSEPVREIEIMLALPPENVEIQKDSMAGPTAIDVNPTTGLIKYAPIPVIKPGQTILCKVEVKAQKAGTFQAHVQLLEKGAPRSQKTRETIVKP